MSFFRVGMAIVITLLLAALWRFLEERATASAPAIERILGPRSQIDIRELLRQGLESSNARLHVEAKDLELSVPVHPLTVLVDRPRMQEVFAQLMDLARSVMSSGSTLQVLARVDGTHAVVNFMDVPAGIDSPTLGRWFDRVYACSLRRNPRDKGDAASRVALLAQVVSEHGGRIYAAPSPLGSLGITLRLPLLQGPRYRQG